MMYFACDESGGIEFRDTAEEIWRVSTVGGVLFGYATRRWWKENYRHFPQKAKDYSIDQMVEVLQALCKFKCIAICHIIYQSTNFSEVKQFQNDFILSCRNPIANEPDMVRKSRHHHLDNLQKMKPETFVKTFALLELMTDGIGSYINWIGNKRSQDQRGLNIIVDDQVKPIVPATEDFVWYFLNCRSAAGAFTCPKDFPKNLQSFTWLDDQGKKRFNITKFIKIKIGKQGEKLDDTLVELRLAD